MKKSLMLIMLICTMGMASAQDIIVKKDGNVIKAKVVELTETSVLYKNHSNLEGPTYTIRIENIFSLTYENGEKETFANASAAPKEQESSTPKNNDISKSVYLSQIANLQSKAETIESVGKIVTGIAFAGTIVGWVIAFGGNASFGNIMIGTGISMGVLFGGLLITKAIAKPSWEEANRIRKSMRSLSNDISVSPVIIPQTINGKTAVGLNLCVRF